MAIQHVQTKASTMATGTTIAMNFNSGNCAVIFAGGWQASSSPVITGVSSLSNGTWTYAVTTTSASNRFEGFYIRNNLIAGSDTVTVAWDIGLGDSVIECSEYSGVNLTNPICGSNMFLGGVSSTSQDINLVATKSNAMYIYGVHLLADTNLSGNGTERSKKVVFMACQVMDTLGTASAISGIWTLNTAAFTHRLAFALAPENSSERRMIINTNQISSIKTTDSRIVVR